MKRCVMLAMAMTVAVNSYGGLFDNVIKNAVGVALPQEREKEQERRRAAIIAEQEERARQEELRKAEEHKAYMAKLEQDEKERRRKREAEEAERRRAEEEAERRRAAIIAEQEERARQEELRKAEEHKACMAKLEQDEKERRRKREAEEAERRRQQEAEVAERQRQREAERAERKRIAEEKEREEEKARKECERIASAQRISGPLRSCRDGSTRESLYIRPEDVKDASQFAAKPVIAGKVPLYKSISSGSTLAWSLGKLLDFSGQNAFGVDIKIRSMKNTGMDDFDYDGISVSMPKGKDSSDALCLYCSSEGLDKEIERIEQMETALDGVVVFGVGKTFTGDTAASDVIGMLQQKYPGLKITEKRWKTEDLCLDLAGLVRKGSHLRLEFANDSVRGIIEEERCEFEKFDLDSPDARFMLYFSSREALKRSNKFAAEEFEQSFNTASMQIRADVKNGKYKKDIARFKFGAGSVDDFKRRQQLTSETVFVMNTAAKQVLSERSFSQLRKDAIKRGKAEMLNIQSEIFTPGSHSANVLAAIPRTSVGMTIFDAKALESLTALKRERTEAKLREEQARKDAQKAKSLDF